MQIERASERERERVVDPITFLIQFPFYFLLLPIHLTAELMRNAPSLPLSQSPFKSRKLRWAMGNRVFVFEEEYKNLEHCVIWKDKSGKIHIVPKRKSTKR